MVLTAYEGRPVWSDVFGFSSNLKGPDWLNGCRPGQTTGLGKPAADMLHTVQHILA
jgi:hypothetical protein